MKRWLSEACATPEKSLSRLWLGREPAGSCVSFFLRKEPITGDVRLIGSRVTAREGKDVPPMLDSPCISSSTHQITEEVNYQFAQQITNVASTGESFSFSRENAYTGYLVHPFKKDGFGLPVFRFSGDVSRTDGPSSQYRVGPI